MRVEIAAERLFDTGHHTDRPSRRAAVVFPRSKRDQEIRRHGLPVAVEVDWSDRAVEPDGSQSRSETPLSAGQVAVHALEGLERRLHRVVVRNVEDSPCKAGEARERLAEGSDV